MTDEGSIRHRLAEVRERISSVGGHAVRIVAVTKGHDALTLESAIKAGCSDIAESYAQELLVKHQGISEQCRAQTRVHFVGGLQRNKIRKLTSTVDLWQSVDRLELGVELARHCPQASAMVQVNVSGDDTKRGCSPKEAPELVQRLQGLELEVVGLMGIGPIGEPEDSRRGFALLRGLVDQLGLAECSMGMSADLEVAVQEGSTMVRVGTGLFGPRPPRN